MNIKIYPYVNQTVKLNKNINDKKKNFTLLWTMITFIFSTIPRYMTYNNNTLNFCLSIKAHWTFRPWVIVFELYSCLDNNIIIYDDEMYLWWWFRNVPRAYTTKDFNIMANYNNEILFKITHNITYTRWLEYRVKKVNQNNTVNTYWNTLYRICTRNWERPV